jgi:antitoxin MazE
MPEVQMKSRIVQIGNSQGIRLPKVLLKEAQLTDEVELEAEPGRIVIRRGRRPRAGWAAAARKMRERDKDRLLGHATPTRFEEKEWQWR